MSVLQYLRNAVRNIDNPVGIEILQMDRRAIKSLGDHQAVDSECWCCCRFLRLHTLAFLDYVVVVLDSRGSSHRGVQFEAHIKGRLVR